MQLSEFLHLLIQDPEKINFKQTIALIDANYTYFPTSFRNGDLYNNAGENEGSCKIFAFAKLHNLSKAETLACFGEFYRKDVLDNPNGTGHQNIRSFMKTGWGGIKYEHTALKNRSN